MYTNIQKMQYPKSAVAGEVVAIQVLIKNRYNEAIHIAPTALVNGIIPVSFAVPHSLVEAHGTCEFSGSFTMPSTDARIEVDSYYWTGGYGDQWFRDDYMSKTVSLEGDRLKRLVINRDPFDAGEVTVSPMPVERTIYNGVYPRGRVVRVTARPFPNYLFTCWGGDAPDTIQSSIRVRMTEDRDIIAHFEQLSFEALELRIEPLGGGCITTEPASEDGCFPNGTRVRVTAHPNEGYIFDHLSGDIKGEISFKNRAFVDIFEPATVVAHFQKIEEVVEAYKIIELDISPLGAGSIAIKPTPLIGKDYVTGLSQVQFMKGTKVTLTTLPNLGYEFECWMDEGDMVNTNPTYTLNIVGDKAVRALFREVEPV